MTAVPSGSKKIRKISNPNFMLIVPQLKGPIYDNYRNAKDS
jgi:hypothetical protein